MSDLLKKLAAAHEVKNHFDEMIVGSNVQDTGQARVSATLCLTISEQYAAVLCLIESQLSSHAPIIVRSMLEGLANLLNLVNDASYLDQMRFEDAHSNNVLFEECTKNPDVRDDKEAIARFSEWKAEGQPLLDELKKRGLKKQNITDKFDQAKISDCYIAYRVLCSSAHNQLTALTSRHAGKFEMRYHDDAPEENTVRVITIAMSILWQAIETLPKFTDVLEGQVTLAIKDAEKIWSAVGESEAIF